MTSAVQKLKTWCLMHGRDYSSNLAMAAIQELEAENERIKSKLQVAKKFNVGLSADIDELGEKLAQYESAPERALKAVMSRHNLSFNGSIEAIAIIQSPNKTIAVCSETGPCCGTFTLKAEDIVVDE